MADLTEPENRRDVSYGKSRFEGSGQPGPGIIRIFDGHIMPFKVEREIEYDDGIDLTNVYECEDY